MPKRSDKDKNRDKSKDEKKPVEIVVVVPSYNNERFCEENVELIAKQTYPHFSIYYIDDASTDKTGELVENYVKTHGLEKKCTIVHNKERKGVLENIYNAVHQIDPEKVVVLVDGDDWLAHDKVLERVAKAYENKKIWLTFGTLQTAIGRELVCRTPFPEDVIKNCTFRTHDWVSSHLKTFYAKLFQKIKKEDLQKEGKFFPMSGDMAIMFPMLEMASRGHFEHIKEVLYIYNTFNPLSDFQVNISLQRELALYIRRLPPYKPLKKLF